jgi:pheromone shutdown protein TraB
MLGLQVARTLMPEVVEVLIDSRDAAIARKLLEYSANDTAERKDYDDDDGEGPVIVAILGIAQLDGVQQHFYSNYVDEGSLFEEGMEGAKAHSNVFEVQRQDQKARVSDGSINAAGWRRMFGLLK